jgi:type III restriction enzyme
MLWLYKRGYRNFIFFVDKKNIIQKTRDNFLLNQHSIKYLFTDSIEIEGEKVSINEVQNFDEANEDDINIVFTTIGGLHMKLNKPRENSLTYEDFEDTKLALLSDEAHHINALTRSNPAQQELEDMSTWEQTVRKIHNANKENVLLEFTATIDLEDENIFEKYKNKLLFQYSLEKFRLDGYSKDIYMTIAGADPLQRALLALILSQYLRKIAESHGIALKPVVLFKSIYIKDSEKLKKGFDEMVQNLSGDKIKQVEKQIDEQAPDLNKAFNYFKEHNISYADLARELQFEFAREKCIIVDSESITDEKQKKLNNLEDNDNEVRAIFAVKQLDEGWDVLNLFDIVKMNDSFTRNTTLQERQLIGRGARYFPFGDKDSEMYFKRKFDEASEEKKELRIIEKLNYHCQREVSYIRRLRKGLQEDGIYPKQSSTREIELKLKDEVKQSDFYKKKIVFVNKKVLREGKSLKTLAGTQVKDSYTYELPGSTVDEEELFEEAERTNGMPVREKMIEQFPLSSFDTCLVRGALEHYGIFQFNRLKKMFPELTSLDEFINFEDYLGGIYLNISGDADQLDDLGRVQYFRAVKKILDDLRKDIGHERSEYKGSTTFHPIALRSRVKNKSLSIMRNEASDKERGIGMRDTEEEQLRFDVRKRDWYMYEENYGTSEEKSFIKFLDKAMEELKENYEDIYLLRNEEFFKFYDFAEGRGFEPDFLLFMKKEETEVSYQVFIEPKGKYLRETDKWKEDFLAEMDNLQIVYENEDFRLVGLPFYTEGMNDQFEEQWERQFVNLTSAS